VAELPTGTVTLLFTDIEGSTRLLERLGDRYVEVLGDHRRLLRDAFAQFNGHEVSTDGDAFFVAFSRANDAVAAAVAAQRAIGGNRWPDGTRLQVRMGIHTGQPIVVADDYAGMDVHRAARTCAAGHGGQVVVSQVTQGLLRQDLPSGVELRDLGEHRLKDLTHPQRLYQLVIPGLPADFPALRTLGPRPLNLPLQLTSFVGRERELARLHELLDDPACRLVTLVGPGGIGKTRLALEIAMARQARSQDDVVFVSFVGTVPAKPEEGVDLVIANLANAVGVSLAVPRDPLELLAEHLATHRFLLVLDNLEQLGGATRVLAEPLRRAPEVQMLATSRRRLGLVMERLVEVAGLPYPPSGADTDLDSYGAVQLFQDRAQLARPDLPTVADAEGVARLCRQLAGVPLGIELAARLTRSASPTTIADQLASGLDLLATNAPGVERRHQSVRSVIDWSWQLLTDPERQVLGRLSVLRGSFDLTAAEAIADATLPLLASLVDASLVEVGDDDRYGMHEFLRQYAAERLASDSTEEQATRWRHAEHYAALLPDPAKALSQDETRLDPETENLRAATDWLLAHADLLRLDAHLARLWPLYRRRGWFREAQVILTTALGRDEVPTLACARWHRLLGETHMQLGEMGPARDHFERTLSLLDSPIRTSVPGSLEMLASQALQRQLRRLEPGGPVDSRDDRRVQAEERASVCWQLGEAYWQLGEQPLLIPVSLWGLNQAERAGRLDLAAMNQVNLGMLLGGAGLRRLGDRHVRAAVAAADQAGDPFTLTWAQVVGSLHWLGVGDWPILDARLPKALEAGARAKLHRSVDQAVLLGAVCRYLTGRFDEATAMAAQGMAAGRERHDPMVRLWGLVVMIESRLRIDPSHTAIAGWLKEAGQLLTSGVPKIDVVRTHLAAARFQLVAGHPADALRGMRTADELAGPEPSLAQYTLEGQAGVLEVCLALLERGEPAGTDPAELQATATRGLRRLRRYARSFPMARPRALTCQGWYHWLESRHRVALKAWAQAVQESERLAMPWELARAHYELGRHLADSERSSFGLQKAEHLDQARGILEALGCGTYPANTDALI
jgi:predicted ATPase/class 3 adenylate cyclase